MRASMLSLLSVLCTGCDQDSQAVVSTAGKPVDDCTLVKIVEQPERTEPTIPSAVPDSMTASAQAVNAEAVADLLTPVLQGRVVDEQGFGLPGITVQPYSGIATRFACEKVVTDSGGNFEVSTAKCGTPMWNSETGVRRVLVGITFQDTTYASVDGLSWWDVEIIHEPGIVHPREFVMAPGGEIEGTLVDAATGEPLALGMRLYTGESGATKFFRYFESDAHGAFREEGLAPGEYTIDANGVDGRYPVLGHCTVRSRESVRVELRLERPHAE